MNLAFRRELVPLMYLPRMGDNTSFRRFDDIWGGVIAQKCLRHLGLLCSVGKPIVNHMKASVAMTTWYGSHQASKPMRSSGRSSMVSSWLSAITRRCAAWAASVHRLAKTDYKEVRDEQLRYYLPMLGAWILEWCEQFVRAGWKAEWEA